MPTPPISTSTFQAPLFRTSFGPGESPNLHKTNSGEIFLRTSLGPDQMRALSTRVGDGAATSPSFGDRALSFLKGKFEAFVGKLESFGEKLGTLQDSAREGINAAIGSARAYVSEKIDALTERFSHSPAPTSTSTSTPTSTSTSTPTSTATATPSSSVAHVPADMTSHAGRDALSTVYDSIRNSADQVDRTNIGSFLRGSGASLHNRSVSEANTAASKNFAVDVYQKLPSDGLVVVSAKHYDPVTSAFRTDGKALIDAGNEHAVAQRSADCFRQILEAVFGHDEASAKAAAGNFSQATKDLMVTGLKAIDDSSMPAELRDACKQRFLADVILRTLNPELATFKGGSDIEKASLKEVAKLLQTFMNTGHFESTDPTNKAVLDLLKPLAPQMQTNMRTMFAEAVSQGRLPDHVQGLELGRIDIS